jgi:hypothetical protein
MKNLILLVIFLVSNTINWKSIFSKLCKNSNKNKKHQIIDTTMVKPGKNGKEKYKSNPSTLIYLINSKCIFNAQFETTCVCLSIRPSVLLLEIFLKSRHEKWKKIIQQFQK